MSSSGILGAPSNLTNTIDGLINLYSNNGQVTTITQNPVSNNFAYFPLLSSVNVNGTISDVYSESGGLFLFNPSTETLFAPNGNFSTGIQTGGVVSAGAISGTTISGTVVTGSVSVGAPIGNLTTVNSTTGNITTVNATTVNATNVVASTAVSTSNLTATGITSLKVTDIVGNTTVTGVVGITGTTGITGNTSILGTFTTTGIQSFNAGAFGSSGDFSNPTTNIKGSTVNDGGNIINFENSASLYGRNILYMTGRYQTPVFDAWSFTAPRNGISFRTQAVKDGGYTQRYTIQNNFQELGILCAGKAGVPITVWSNDGKLSQAFDMSVAGLLTATTFQSSGNGLNTSSSTTIISTLTDWTTAMGSFATITSSAGLQGAGLGIAVDSTGNTWALSLEPGIAWKNYNQVASSYSYYTDTFGSATPVLNINSNGTSTFRSNILLKGNSSKGTEQANGPNLVCYVSSDSYARPTMSTFSYDHNDMALMFDIYYVSGTGFVTSYNAINWMFQKYGNTMAFRYVPANVAGTTVTPVTTLLLTSTATIVEANPLKLRGPAATNSLASNAPNMLLYTDSDAYAYPTISTFNYSHNNNAIQFDMYYQAGWYSSFNSVNWQIYKNTDRLFFQYINAVPAGTAGPLQNMMVLTNTGVVISPTSGSYVAPNVLHLIKDVPAIGDTSLMITWENTTGGYYDFLAGYYRVPDGGGTWSVRGGTTSYTTSLPLLTVYYNGYVGVNGVTGPNYALDTGNSSIGCSTINSSIGLTFQTGSTSEKLTINAGGDGMMILNQTVYHNISQKTNLTSGSVAAWQGGLLISRNASQGGTDTGMLLGYSDTLGSGIIVSLQPSVIWRNLYFYAQIFYYYYQGTLAGYINAGGFVNVSDEREKEDIKPLKTTRSLERVLACKPMTYKRKCTDPLTTEDTKNKNYIGLLAQQTCESNPHCVSQWENEEKEERLGIQYNDYVVHLIGAVQEQQKQIATLQDVVKRQQAQIDALLSKYPI